MGLIQTFTAVTLAGGILASGIYFTGTDALNSVKAQADALTSKVQLLDRAKTGLENLLGTVQADASAKLKNAGDVITNRQAKINDLTSQIATLTKQLADSTALSTAEKTDAQTEINRLQGELAKANKAADDLNNAVTADTASVSTLGTKEFAASDYNTTVQSAAGVPSIAISNQTVWNQYATANQTSELTKMDNVLNLQDAFGITLIGLTWDSNNGLASYTMNEDTYTHQADATTAAKLEAWVTAMSGRSFQIWNKAHTVRITVQEDRILYN